MQNKIEYLKSELSLKRKIYLALIMAVLAFVAAVITARADTPLWTFKGAKWYSMMETGNVMVGLPNGVAMLDGANGKTLWQRNDLGEIKETNTPSFPARRSFSFPIIPVGRSEKQNSPRLIP